MIQQLGEDSEVPPSEPEKRLLCSASCVCCSGREATGAAQQVHSEAKEEAAESPSSAAGHEDEGQRSCIRPGATGDPPHEAGPPPCWGSGWVCVKHLKETLTATDTVKSNICMKIDSFWTHLSTKDVRVLQIW